MRRMPVEQIYHKGMRGTEGNKCGSWSYVYKDTEREMPVKDKKEINNVKIM